MTTAAMNERLTKAGFNQSTSQPKEVMSEAEVEALKARGAAAAQGKQDCTSNPKTPENKPLESGIKLVSGQITEYNAAAHSLTVKDKAGVHHLFVWPGPMQAKMEKLKQWFFVSISAEKSGDYWKVIDQQYFKKPDDWPVSQKYGTGGKPQYQRNDKIIVLQVTYKECCDTARHMLQFCEKFEPEEMDRVMDWAVQRAIKDGEALCKAGGC